MGSYSIPIGHVHREEKIMGIIILFFLLGICSIFVLRKTRQNFSIEGKTVIQIVVNAFNIVVTTVLLLASGVQLRVGEVFLHYDKKVLLLSIFFVLMVYLFLYAILGFDWGNLVGNSVLTILSVGNFYKMAIRKDAVVPSDFSLSQFKNMYENMLDNEMKQLILYVLMFLVIVGAFTIYWFRKYPLRNKYSKKRKIIQRGILFGIGMLFFGGVKVNAGELYQKAGLNNAPSNAVDNVNNNGAILHFWGNLSHQLMMKPENYSEATIKRIMKDIERNSSLEETVKNSLDKPNIIFILSESFWDPTTLNNITFEKDPMPFIHSIVEKSGGKMLSPEFGGNTANVEFNVMTGFSSNFIIGGKIPYTNLATEPSSNYSVVDTFKRNEYKAIAMHPFVSYFFGREQVFKNFGFDQALFEEQMNHEKNTVGAYTSDQQFVEDIKKIDQEQTNQGNPYFLHAISMQNHFPYDKTFKYLNSPFVKDYSTIPGGEELNLYANGVAKTDQAMRDLLTYLEGKEQETYVVFYGDHLPALNDKLYEQHLNVPEGSTYDLSKHEPTYFVWSNRENPAITGSISPNYLASQVMAKAGLKTTGFQRFLNHVYKEVPAFSPLGYLEKEGTKKELTKKQKQLLRTYQLLQYDMLEGKKYAKQLFIEEEK